MNSEKPTGMESEGGIISHSTGAVRARAEGASVVQVELGMGKSAAILLWLSSFVAAASIIGVIVLWQSQSNVNRITEADIAVVMYDLAQVRASLIEQGLYEPSSH